jgi:hypothetical protein
MRSMTPAPIASLRASSPTNRDLAGAALFFFAPLSDATTPSRCLA